MGKDQLDDRELDAPIRLKMLDGFDGLHPSEMINVMEDRKIWRFNLKLLPPQPSRKSGQ